MVVLLVTRAVAFILVIVHVALIVLGGLGLLFGWMPGFRERPLAARIAGAGLLAMPILAIGLVAWYGDGLFGRMRVPSEVRAFWVVLFFGAVVGGPLVGFLFDVAYRGKRSRRRADWDEDDFRERRDTVRAVALQRLAAWLTAASVLGFLIVAALLLLPERDARNVPAFGPPARPGIRR